MTRGSTGTMPPCANKAVVIMNPVSLAYPQRDLPQPHVRRRFLYTSCLGGVCGQGEVLNYPVYVSCPTSSEDHNAASPYDLCCAIGRAKKWNTCLILEYQDARRNPQGGSAYASRPSLTVRALQAYLHLLLSRHQRPPRWFI